MKFIITIIPLAFLKVFQFMAAKVLCDVSQNFCVQLQLLFISEQWPFADG